MKVITFLKLLEEELSVTFSFWDFLILEIHEKSSKMIFFQNEIKYFWELVMLSF